MREVDGDQMRYLEGMAREIGGLLGGAIKRSGTRYGFCLMLFSFEGPEFTYVSNSNREDTIRMLEEFIARAKKGEADQLWSERS